MLLLSGQTILQMWNQTAGTDDGDEMQRQGFRDNLLTCGLIQNLADLDVDDKTVPRADSLNALHSEKW